MPVSKHDLSYRELETFLGHTFKDASLLKGALRHPSCTAFKNVASFERLEFLGDRVLGCIIAEALYQAFPKEEEGHLSHRLADLVRKESLGKIVKTWPLEHHLQISKSLVKGNLPLNVLADAGEALLGALFLDGGFSKTQTFILTHWMEHLKNTSQTNLKDSKSVLQEWAQGQGFSLPTYTVLTMEGPDHAPRFQIEVLISHATENLRADAWGPSRKHAEQLAAQNLLEILSLPKDPQNKKQRTDP